MEEKTKDVASMYYNVFRETHRDILAIVNEHEIAKGHNREVSAYLCFLTFAILDEDAPKYIPVSPDEFMYQRMRLYVNLSHSDLLNNWLCPDIPDMNGNPLFTAFIAFGDLLINSNARKDYRSAPAAIHDLSETALFAMSMLKRVLPLTDKYIDYLLSVKQNLQSQSISQETRVLFEEAKQRERLVQAKRAEQEAQKRRVDTRNLIVGLLAIAMIMLLIYHFVVQDEKNSISQGKAYSSTATSAPVSTYNGKWIILPDYSRVCPLEIVADSSSDYYIYLDYQRAPSYSQEVRKKTVSATPPYESDLAFIVKAGRSLEVNVPIGVYKLYYATGSTFFGSKELFGDETSCYEADELLTFNLSAGYYNGHTITLYSTYGGNFDTDEISERNFPTR